MTRFYERPFHVRQMLSLRKHVHQRPQALVFDLEFLHVAKRFRGQASIAFAPTIERSQRDMGGAANFSNRDASIRFIEKEQDLLLSVLRVSHRRAPDPRSLLQ